MGGGFGNKGAGHIEPIVASLAQKTRRPVKIALTRDEVFTATSVRHPSVTYIKDALKNDGTMLGRQIILILQRRGYSLAGNVAVGNSIHGMTSVYTAALKADIYRVYTNQVQGGAFRGFGAPQIYFAVESQMDLIAHQLGIDPLELRMKNLLKDGEKTAIGHRVTNNTIEECIGKVVAAVKSKPISQGRRESGETAPDLRSPKNSATFLFPVWLMPDYWKMVLSKSGPRQLTRARGFTQSSRKLLPKKWAFPWKKFEWYYQTPTSRLWGLELREAGRPLKWEWR